MPIAVEHIEEIRTTPERAWQLIDDLPRFAEWLPPCVSLSKVGSGPNAVGDTLRYVFQQGGRQQEMSGRIVAREAGARLHCLYDDSAFTVSVDLRVEPAANGTRTTHRIAITPKTLMGRLMSPLIRLGLRKQTTDAARNLRRLLETV
ncbi:MAG: SRPBCC family protein [Gemmatimonadaceae bacterium]|nr:SRPBCC family protein [Gemmatimonadaceae bacterium]